MTKSYDPKHWPKHPMPARSGFKSSTPLCDARLLHRKPHQPKLTGEQLVDELEKKGFLSKADRLRPIGDKKNRPGEHGRNRSIVEQCELGLEREVRAASAATPAPPALKIAAAPPAETVLEKFEKLSKSDPEAASGFYKENFRAIRAENHRRPNQPGFVTITAKS